MVAVSGIFRRHRKATTAVGTVVALIAMMAVGFSYWTGGGSGTGTVKNAGTVANVVVSQNASTGALAPGTSVPLSGTLTNPNTTDIKVGTLTATITGVDGGATVGDFTLTNNPVLVNAVVKKGAPLAWSGMTLSYANTDVNQDNGKSATVTITYALSPFVEPPAPPATGTFSYTNKVLVIQNVASWPTSTGSMVVQPGDKLVVHAPASGLDPAKDYPVTTAGADGFNFSSAPYAYYLDGTAPPAPLALVRGTTVYPRSPAWMVG